MTINHLLTLVDSSPNVLTMANFLLEHFGIDPRAMTVKKSWTMKPTAGRLNTHKHWQIGTTAISTSLELVLHPARHMILM